MLVAVPSGPLPTLGITLRAFEYALRLAYDNTNCGD